MRLRDLFILFVLAVFFAPCAATAAQIPSLTSSQPATAAQPSIPSDPRGRGNPLIVPRVF